MHAFHCSLLRIYVDNPYVEYEIYVFLNKVVYQDLFNKSFY